MKFIIQVLLFSFFSLFSIEGRSNDYSRVDTLEVNDPRDTIKKASNKWPDCPKVKNIRFYDVSQSEVLIKWDALDSDRVDYEINIVDDKQMVIANKFLNSSSFLFSPLKQGKTYSVEIKSHCYTDNSIKAMTSIWSTAKSSVISSENGNICAEFMSFIIEGDGSEGNTFTIDGLPSGIALSLDICQNGDCLPLYGSDRSSNSVTIAGSVLGVTFRNIIFTTATGTISCDEWDPEEVDCNLPVQVSTAIESQESGSSISIQIANILTSTCGSGLEVNIIPPDGAENMTVGYDAESTIQAQTFSYTGCGIYEISVTSGAGACPCDFTLDVPCGPNGPPPTLECELGGEPTQSISLSTDCSTGEPITTLNIVETYTGSCDLSSEVKIYNQNGETITSMFPIPVEPIILIGDGPFTLEIINTCDAVTEICTHTLDVACPPAPSTCCDRPPTCDDLEIEMFYPGFGSQILGSDSVCIVTLNTEYDVQLELKIINENSTLQTVKSNESGFVSVPSGSEFILSYTLSWTDENGILHEVECSTNLVADCSNSDPSFTPDPSLCDLVLISTVNLGRGCGKSWNAPDSVNVFIMSQQNGYFAGIDMSNLGSNYLYFSEIIEYIVTYENENGEIFIANCYHEVDPCSDEDFNPEEDLCENILIEIDSTDYLPYYVINWVIYDAPQIELTYTVNGEVYNSTSQSGDIQISPGDIVEFDITLTEGENSSNCPITITTTPLEPEGIDEDILCSFLSLIEAEIGTDSLLYLTIAGGDEQYIESYLTGLGIDMATIESYLSQLEYINISIDYTNDEFPNGNNLFLNIYNNPTGSYNGGSSYYFDPEDWTMIIDDISTLGISGTFELEIQDVEGNNYECGPYDLPVDIIELIEVDNEFGLSCDSDPEEDFDPSVPIYCEKIQDLVGQVVIIRGFPVMVCTIDGPFPSSGTGISSLPFESTEVLVEFSGLTVNKILEATTGSVVVVKDDPGNYPQFVLPQVPLNIGGDICLPPPPPPNVGPNGENTTTGLDDYGFDPTTGLHNDTDKPWDTNGFDIHGNYVFAEPPYNPDGTPNLLDPSEMTPYNPDGCSREGMDDQDPSQPCDPSGSDEDISSFIDSTETEVKIAIGSILKAIVAEVGASITELNCNQYRAVIDTKISALGYERGKIVGDNDEYYITGMHKRFEEEPKKFEIDISGRNEDTEILENNHVYLYECDIKEAELLYQQGIAQQICDDPDNQEVYDHIVELIEAWGSIEKALYLNYPAAFDAWVAESVRAYIDDKSNQDDGYGYTDPQIQVIPHLREALNFSDYNRGYTAVASTEDVIFQPSEFEAAQFAFMQGDQEIHGIHRAYFLRALHELAVELNGTNVQKLPIIVTNQIGSYEYTIYIDNVTWGVDQEPTLDAHFIMEDQESGQSFALSGIAIPFGPGGLASGPGSRLHLGTDIEIKLNNASMLILKGTENTYVEWSCEGFQGMGVDMAIEFCRNIIVPLEANYTPKPDPIRYRLEMVTTITEWLEFTFIVNSPGPFAMAKFEDIKFDFTDITVDMSSTSGGGIRPLSGYDSDFLADSILTDAWKGFHIAALSVVLPNQFNEGGSIITVSANDVIIDGSGVTGQTAVSNESLLSPEEGNMGGWPLGINKFGMKVINNHVAGIDIGGLVNVPIFEEYMAYDATIYPGDKYEFTVSPLESATVNMMLATATIENNSSISMSYENEVFTASALLTGAIEVNGSSEESTIDFNIPKLNFTNLKISNHAPYFSPGTWQISDDLSAKFKGFDLTLSNINMYKPGSDPTEAALGFDLGLKLSVLKGLDINGSLGVVGKMLVEDDRQRWVYSHLDPNAFCINTSFPGVSRLDGCLTWFPDGETPDPVYGEGFRGSIEVEFTGFGNSMSAVGQFGKVNGYKYFFVDAMGNFSPGIAAGPLMLNGFGGGISHHMDNTFNPGSVDFDDLSDPGDSIGESYSGIIYTPNQDTGLGLRASTLFTLAGKEELFNGSLEMGMAFNSNTSGQGGLSGMYLKGLGKFLSEPTADISILNNLPDDIKKGSNVKPNINAAISGFVYFEYDFNAPSFVGDIGVFLDAGPLVGRDNGKLVNGKLNFTPTEWHIQFGMPDIDQRCGALLQIGSTAIDLNSYFVAGSSIPSIPPIPQSVRDIAYSYKPFAGLGSPGPGMAFGAGLTVDVNVKAAGIIEGYLLAEAGFDVMLKKYSGITCGGSAIGINGWYAAGQAYAAISGGLKFFGVEVFKTGVAAILQARLPNPTFLSGNVGVEFKVMHKKFKKSISVNIGDDCTFESSDPNAALGLDVIAYFDPYDSGLGIVVDTKPIVYMNVPVDQEFEVEDLNGERHEYIITKPSQEQVSMTTSEGEEIPFTINILDGNTEIEISPLWMFPENDTITLEVTVDIYMNGDSLTSETKSTTFVTDEGFCNIPESNVVSSYPVNGMYNYYKEEHTDCYIELDLGQPELFYDIPEDMEQAFLLTGTSGSSSNIDYLYDPETNRVNFHLDPELLQNGEMYKLQLLRGEDIYSTAGSSSVASSSNNQASSVGMNANGSTHEGPKNKVLFTAFFRASEYNTIAEKIAAIQQLPDHVESTQHNGTIIYKDMDSMEPFTSDENISSTYDNAVSTTWFQSNYGDKLYSLFPKKMTLCDGGIYPFLDTDHLIENSVVIVSENNLEITGSVFRQGIVPSGRSQIQFQYSKLLKHDFIEAKFRTMSCIGQLQEYCGNASFQEGNGDPPPTMTSNECHEEVIGVGILNFRDDPFVDILNGDYKVKIKYSLPDGNLSSSSYGSRAKLVSIQDLSFTK